MNLEGSKIPKILRTSYMDAPLVLVAVASLMASLCSVGRAPPPSASSSNLEYNRCFGLGLDGTNTTLWNWFWIERLGP